MTSIGLGGNKVPGVHEYKTNPNFPKGKPKPAGIKKGKPVGKNTRTDAVKNSNNRGYQAPATQSKPRRVVTTESYVAGSAAPRRITNR